MTVFQSNAQYRYKAIFNQVQKVTLDNGRTVEKPVPVFTRWAKYQTLTEKFRNTVVGFNETTDVIINVREIYNDPIKVGLRPDFYTVDFNGEKYRIYAVSPNQKMGGGGYHIITLRRIDQTV